MVSCGHRSCLVSVSHHVGFEAIVFVKALVDAAGAASVLIMSMGMKYSPFSRHTRANRYRKLLERSWSQPLFSHPGGFLGIDLGCNFFHHTSSFCAFQHKVDLFSQSLRRRKKIEEIEQTSTDCVAKEE